MQYLFKLLLYTGPFFSPVILSQTATTAYPCRIDDYENLVFFFNPLKSYRVFAMWAGAWVRFSVYNRKVNTRPQMCKVWRFCLFTLKKYKLYCFRNRVVIIYLFLKVGRPTSFGIRVHVYRIRKFTHKQTILRRKTHWRCFRIELS